MRLKLILVGRLANYIECLDKSKEIAMCFLVQMEKQSRLKHYYRFSNDPGLTRD